MPFVIGEGAAMEASTVLTENSDNRREPRQAANSAITFSQLNKKENYIGIAKNFSRSGMFFFSTRKLNPGTCIVILPLVCQSNDLLWGDGECGAVATSICSAAERQNQNMQNFVNMVTAKVTRCEFMKDAEKLRYAVAVDYLRPTI
jgi:hypothetical protein